MRKEVDQTFANMRDRVADRLDEFDVKGMRKQLAQLTETVADRLENAQNRVQQRVRPQPRRRFPIAGLVLLGSIAGMALLFYDSRRRTMMRDRMMQLQGEAKRQLPEMRNKATQAVGGLRQRGSGANGGAEQARLQSEVESAIRGGQTSMPSDLDVSVEGRTVYLRGSIAEREMLDQVVERAQSVTGVAAVINLVSVVPSAAR
jgi:DNA primase